MCERLETFPNVDILEFDSTKTDFGVDSPTTWTPVADGRSLERGEWIYSKHFWPIFFKIHLPTKLQDKIFPSFPEVADVEDFIVAYDGMIFVGAAEAEAIPVHPFSGPPIRKYLQQKLLKSIGDFTPAVIPPSPMQLTLDLTLSKPRTSDKEDKFSGKYDPRLFSIRVSALDEPHLSSVELLKELYFTIRNEVQTFYSLMTSVQHTEDLHRLIRETAKVTHSTYADLLQLTTWNVVRKMQLIRQLSILMAQLHQTFCNHSQAVAELGAECKEFLKDLSDHELFGMAEEYFAKFTQPEELDYSVYSNSLEHMRSHLLVLEQNRHLLYAALVGSFLTLAGTALGLFLSQ